jgi:hypothetical protein
VSAISFSHGPAWKALISTYIGTMPPSHEAPGMAEQSMSSGPPPMAVTSAMTAKVGAAARESQSAAPLILRIMTGRPAAPSRSGRGGAPIPW